MPSEAGGFVVNSRPKWTPLFLREIETLGNQIGVIDAVHETLRRDNVTVDVEGDFERVQDHPDGILFVGDHKNQWEFVALMDMLSRMGRDDMFNIAKFYVQRQVHQALGHAASRLVLPVYPRILARDRGEFFNSEVVNRLLYRRHLLTMAESEEANARSLQIASEGLVGGGVVNIFPCGSVVDARKRPWRSGVGEIIRQVPDENKEDVLVVPYSMKDAPRARLIGAIALRGRGIFGKPQTMDVQLGPVQTAAELMDSLPDSARHDRVAITALLQRQFIDHFDVKQEHI